ncbi:MAG: efflux RND transporter periplasmic adaptor subunit [Alphaproteobacteria bacterium]|nr:efflux RND transporter periplasmic adaptor subunit [Alphaproteobacteria bacterium]
MSAPAAAFGETSPLPIVRRELAISDAGRDATGAGGVILHDPLRHKFFRLPDEAARMFEFWHLGLAGPVAQMARVDISDVAEFSGFLAQARLTVQPAGGSAALEGEFQRGEHSLAEQALHNYLFFRVPLFNPTPLLDALLPFARFLASRMMLWLLLVIGIVGGYFALRQWDKFASTFFDFFSLEGLALYSLTLVGLKFFHELGHGFVARHFGVRVPVMGLAFMILAPMLYTETTDAWRLKSRRQRMLIDAAGVMVEIAIAIVALFLWAFLPDGPWRSMAYFISATAWITSVFINLSPFMRFDGYHLLADGLGMFNLGPRAFALATWQVRQWLFAPREDVPEQFRPGLHRFLVSYAFGVWVYRLSLYLGIAYTVYQMFPKAIGIPMGAIELWFFILWPIWRELKGWGQLGGLKMFATPRAIVTSSIVLAICVLSILPLSRSVSIPAVLLPAQEAWVYPPEASRVMGIYVHSGQKVVAGERLAQLYSPEIGQKQELASLRLAVVDAKLARIAADSRDLAQSLSLQQEQQALRDTLQGLTEREAKLEMRAPISGIVGDLISGVGQGTWLGRDQLLLHVVKPEGAVVAGLVNERDQARLKTGQAAVFIVEDGAAVAIAAKVQGLGVPGSAGIEGTYLSSLNGGAVAMAQEGGRPMPVSGVLPIKLTAAIAAPSQARRGTVTVAAESTSLAEQVFGRLVSVFLRESGF